MTVPAVTDHPVFAALMKRPVSALMGFLLIAVLGVVAYQRIPLMLVPQGLSDPEMEVEVEYPNASPQEVFEHVTKPVEDAVRQLPGIERVESRSESGRSRVDVTFNADIDLDLAYAELKDRLERTRASFPEGVEKPAVWRWNSDLELPIFWIGVLFDSSVEDPYYLVEEVLQKRLAAVDGVAQVGFEGMVLEAVRIFASPEKLRSHGLSLYEVVDLLRRDNFTLPAGTIDDAGRQFQLRIDTSYHTLDQVRNYPLKRGIRIGDVADVRLARSYRDSVSRVNGKRAVTLTISKESDRNTVEVCRAVQEQLAKLRTDERLKGFEFNVYFDQSDLIVGALDNLKSSLLFGALFSVLVLYAFVRRIGVTMLVAMAIPTSLLATLVAMYFTGFTFNIITLAGITLAIGMLVDNSIVVTENVLRLRSKGVEPALAAAGGAGQVGLAIVLSTLTTVVVFAPLVFMAEVTQTRALLTELAAPICFSLLASLLVALFFLPITMLHLGRFQRKRREAVEPSPTDSRLHRLYRRALDASLQRRFAVTCVIFALLAAGQFAFQNVNVDFEGEGEGGGRLRISVDLPDRFTLEEASDVFAQLENSVLPRREELHVSSVSSRFDRRRGRLMLWFEDGAPLNHEKDLAKRLETDLPKIPGVKLSYGFERDSEQGSIRIALQGPDHVVLAKLAEDVIRKLEELPELEDVKPDGDSAVDELHIAFDRREALRYGVSQEALLGIVSWGLGSQQLSPFRGGKREVPMLIEYEEPEIGDLSYLRTLDVPTAGGGTVTLASLGEFRVDKGYGTIRRADGVVSFGISAQSFDPNGYRVARRVAETLDAFPFPDGYRWRDRGQRNDFEESQNEVAKGLLAGSAFVFLLMGMLFESTILPLAILLTIPLALVGASLGLFLSGTPLDSTGMLAFILLAGVVVNFGIVLIDRVQQLRNLGVERRTAILDGCGERLRPVLMTALTTIFGLLPMAMPKVFATSSRGGGIDYQSLAVATLGGMILSTFLTLFIVPVFYTVFDDLSLLLRRVFLGGASGSEKPAPEPASVEAGA